MSDRLFFALWPAESVRAEILQRLPAWTTGLEGRLQRPDQWHVTLEFIGAVETERQAALLTLAQGLTVPRCEVEFDRLEHWRKPQVACLVAASVPAPLVELVERLRAALAASGFTPEPRPFLAHVTLARKVRSARALGIMPPLRWPISSLALVRSVTAPAGSRHEPVHWWNADLEGG